MSYSCDGEVVYRRHGRPLPKMKWKESLKKWKSTFYFIRNINLGWDWVNLPPFADEPPTGEHWDLDLRTNALPRRLRAAGSAFLWQFLEFYGLQMHHLDPNSVLYLACFVTLCEAYLGFWPFPSFFCHFFHLHAHAHGNMSYSCDDVMVYKRRGKPLPKMKWRESFKKWQRNFFYVRNIGLGRDWVNLPTFADEPPTGENCDLDLCTYELAVIDGRLQDLKASPRLVAPDLVRPLSTTECPTVIDLGLELINPVIEPGEVLPNVIGINHMLVGELRDHHVVGVESTLHHHLALEDLLLHCFEPRLHASGLLGPLNITDVQHSHTHLDRLRVLQHSREVGIDDLLEDLVL
ncbi:DNA-directed RNA polymerase subunit beta [Hordeum vulgare]|nr:DNA-directed RNA polymerase subunit beta [Hordeum vulgare]